MEASQTAVALRRAIGNYVHATVENALASRAGLAELHGTEKAMLDTSAALDAAIDATALTLAADMVEGLRQIRTMIDAPHFSEDRKCRIRAIASDLVDRAQALHIGWKSSDGRSDGNNEPNASPR
jgi:hypothetical protein